jgi:hypothetical protein
LKYESPQKQYPIQEEYPKKKLCPKAFAVLLLLTVSEMFVKASLLNQIRMTALFNLANPVINSFIRDHLLIFFIERK